MKQPDTSLGSSPLADFRGDNSDSSAAAMQASHEGFQFYADGNFEAAYRRFELASSTPSLSMLIGRAKKQPSGLARTGLNSVRVDWAGELIILINCGRLVP